MKLRSPLFLLTASLFLSASTWASSLAICRSKTEVGSLTFLLHFSEKGSLKGQSNITLGEKSIEIRNEEILAFNNRRGQLTARSQGRQRFNLAYDWTKRHGVLVDVDLVDSKTSRSILTASTLALECSSLVIDEEEGAY